MQLEWAKRLVEENLLNPDGFWFTYPLATYVKPGPYYYQEHHADEHIFDGTAWVPTD